VVGLLKKTSAPKSLAGFEHVNRYWDEREKSYVAKILPGEFYVTRHAEKIATTLGSCVSACIWDEKFGVGGMNHFMLPLTETEAHKVSWGNVQSDATRYGNYAMEHLINEIMKNGGSRSQLVAKVFGGANVLRNSSDVGDMNVEFVLKYLDCENIPIISQDLKGDYPRKIMFDPLTGKALMKRIENVTNEVKVLEINYIKDIQKSPVEGDIELF